MTNLALLGLLLLGIVLLGMLSAVLRVLAILALPGFVAFLWVSLATGARRLHDRNKSAWWLLLFQGLPLLISVFQMGLAAGGEAGATAGAALSLLTLPISIWAFVELGCLRGTAGPNEFGDDPLMRTSEVFA